MMPKSLCVVSLALGLALGSGWSGGPAFAASPYDGTWIVDFPSVYPIPDSNEDLCPALRLRADVKDGQISGSLARFFPGNVVENATGHAASPVTGTVHPDGSVEAYWLGWIVKGQITGDRADLTLLFGQCGPRHMTGIRVARN
ncbi:MAG TPA: hypothetical protein VLV50_00355 [Stellaceae bacterium]|nr:hypothetical protein [Stellaceae bacterium]